mmetsp:Transcript_26080/g.42756  ORF Transcript_26080/g.42756 Transcript_26080/m.42756 type:complete len:236 (+) Transcript_26080:116-823(+)
MIELRLFGKLQALLPFFTDSGRLVGDEAKNQAYMNPKNTVFNSKRLIGRKFSDAVVQTDIKRWPFEVVAKEVDKPYIRVSCKGEDNYFAAEEISSMILLKMKKAAETYLGTSIKDAVITVPGVARCKSGQGSSSRCGAGWRLDPHSEGSGAAAGIFRRQGAMPGYQPRGGCCVWCCIVCSHSQWRLEHESARPSPTRRDTELIGHRDSGWSDVCDNKAKHNHPLQKEPGLHHILR